MHNAAKIKEFHRAIGADSPDMPTLPSLKLLELRRTLIREEWQEVQAELYALECRLSAGEDVATSELAPLAQELSDLLYVTYGALDQLGIDADAVFAEIHRANLSKASGPKRSDGKQLKPEGWQPADVKKVLTGIGRS